MKLQPDILSLTCKKHTQPTKRASGMLQQSPTTSSCSFSGSRNRIWIWFTWDTMAGSQVAVPESVLCDIVQVPFTMHQPQLL